jgi:hypothetical protein
MTLAGTATVAGLALVFGNPWLTKYLVTSDPLPQARTFQGALGTLRYPTWAVPGVLPDVPASLLLATNMRALLVVALTAVLLHDAGRLIRIRPRGIGVLLVVWGAVILAAAIAGLLASPLLRSALPESAFQLADPLAGKAPVGSFALAQVTFGAAYGFLVGWLPGVVALWAGQRVYDEADAADDAAADAEGATETEAGAAEDAAGDLGAGEGGVSPVWTSRVARGAMAVVAVLVLLLGNPWLTQHLADSAANRDGTRFAKSWWRLLDAVRFPNWGLPGLPDDWSSRLILGSGLRAVLVVAVVGMALTALGRSLRVRPPTVSLLVAVWGTVAVAAGVAGALAAPVVNSGLGHDLAGLPPYILNQAYAGAGFGVLVGWLPALVAMVLASRPLDRPLLPKSGYGQDDDADSVLDEAP